MPKRSGAAHVVTTTRKYKGKVYRTHLLRRSYRDGATVKNETLGNLSHWPEELVDIIRRSLQGETFVPVSQALEVMSSRSHGHVQAVRTAMERLGLAALVSSQPCPERDRVLAMVAARILAPHTKLATTRWWHTTTLAGASHLTQAGQNAFSDQPGLWSLSSSSNASSAPHELPYTEPYVRWCGRAAGVSPPPTRSDASAVLAGEFWDNARFSSGSERHVAKSTLIGGFHAVLAALEDAHDKPFEILLADTRNDDRARRVQALARQHEVRVRVVPRADLDLKALELRHQGVLAYVPEKAFDAEDALYQPAEQDRWFLALDGVQDPHNLGACLRTAEAVGVNAVIIPKDRSASLTAAARAAAAGSAERVPLVAVTNLARTLERLKELGYWTTGLAGEATETLYEVDLSGPVVLVMGAEGEGLRRLTRETCDRLVKIPMQGKTESLNVSVATAVCLYEAYRQRHPSAPRRRK